MKYFKLHIFCKYIYGEKFGCIYNMNTHEMISVESPLKDIIEKAQQNKPLLLEDENILSELVKKGYGTFYDKPNFIESFHYGPNSAIKTMVQPNIRISRCYIQVSNECDLNCCFCNESDGANRRTSCKKWNNKKVEITIEKWSSIIQQLQKLGCEEICFIGGNPFLDLEKMSDIVKLAIEIGIEKFSVYSHETNINCEILSFLKKYHFTFIGTILSMQEHNYKKITGSKKWRNTIKDIKRLKENQVNFIANLIVGNFNEDEIEDIVKTLRENHIVFRLSPIYDKPDNKYSSERHKELMYEKKYDFCSVTKESISFLEEYNSCLYGQISINLSGDITPCPMMNSYVIGNIDSNNVSQIVNSDEYQKLIHLSRNEIDGCNTCAYRFNCFDCRAIEYAATGKITGELFCKYKEDKVE